MQSPASPTLFINVLEFDGKPYAEGDVITDRQQAVREAEDWEDRYLYSLTDCGKINLRPEFSDKYHNRVAYEQHMEAKGDEMREGRA